MAVGQTAIMGDLSYVSIGRESTFGTYATSTAGLNFLSCSLKKSKEVKIIEEIQTSRTNSNAIQLGVSVEGEIEAMFSPRSAACNYLLHNAFGGGTIASATATGETIGGGAFTHIVSINNFNTTYSSLCINTRKGDSVNGKVFEYTGLRVNEYSLMAELDEPLKFNASLIGKDASITGNDVSSAISTTSQIPLSFVNGRFSVETSTGALTTTSYWHVSNVEFKVANNISSDARRIGSDTVQDLPAGLANFELKCTVNFDTTTALDAMNNGTRLAAEFEFLGSTMSGSAIREGIKLQFPYILISEAGDPEIGGPNEILSSEISFAILRDPTSGGYAVRALVTNNTSSY